MLSKKEKQELKRLACSAKLRSDMHRLRRTRHNPFFINGAINVDAYLMFLNEFNSFINHTPKPFSKIIDKDMRL